jgi:hypothetical protein
MTDIGLATLFLFLHVFAAIVAFGPGFIIPVIGRMGSREPAHGNFTVRLVQTLLGRVVIPVALTMPVTGLLVIWFRHIDLANRAYWWLDIAIAIYAITIGIAIFVQVPAVRRFVQVTSGPPIPGGPPGPPPAVVAAAKEVRQNGTIIGVLVVVIVLLMVSKPQF